MGFVLTDLKRLHHLWRTGAGRVISLTKPLNLDDVRPKWCECVTRGDELSIRNAHILRVVVVGPVGNGWSCSGQLSRASRCQPPTSAFALPKAVWIVHASTESASLLVNSAGVAKVEQWQVFCEKPGHEDVVISANPDWRRKARGCECGAKRHMQKDLGAGSALLRTEVLHDTCTSRDMADERNQETPSSAGQISVHAQTAAVASRACERA
jgi:hypothetical protein